MSNQANPRAIKVESPLLMASGMLAIWLTGIISGLQFGFLFVLPIYVAFSAIFLMLAYRENLHLTRYAELAGIGALLLLIIGSWFVAPTDISLILTVVLVAEAPYTLNKRQCWLLLLVCNLAFFAVFWGVWHESEIFITWISMLALQCFAVTSSLARVQEAELKLKLTEQNAELKAARSALAEKSQVEERLRIAGDLHDSIGNQLTALRLQLEAISQVAPEEIKQQLASSQQLSSDLLENIRSIVKRMSSHQILPLDVLIQQIDTATPGVNISLKSKIPPMGAELQEQLTSAIKEGINNAIRHGNASQIDIAFHDYSMSIDDNGESVIEGISLGFGLSNLVHRLEPFGGKVELSKLPKGCRLSIELNPGTFSAHGAIE